MIINQNRCENLIGQVRKLSSSLGHISPGNNNWGCAKKTKTKIEPKNKKNRIKKSVNRKKFQKDSVLLTEPEKFSVFDSVTVWAVRKFG